MTEKTRAHEAILRKVRLLGTNGGLVTEAYSLPFVHWPQAFLWGQRLFVRLDFHTNPWGTADHPPEYFEATMAQAFNGTDLAKLGIV